MEYEYLKKYWWLVLVVIPLVVALIGIVPPLLDGPAPSGVIKLHHTEFSGDLFFTNIEVILDQYEGIHGDPLTDQELIGKIELGFNLVQNKNYEKAIQLFREVSSETRLPSIENNLGVLYAFKNDFENARTFYQKAIEKDPEYQPVYLNLGLLDEREGKVEEAIKHLSKAPDLKEAQKLASKIEGKMKKGRPSPGLGAISISNIKARTVEVYSQESSGGHPSFAGFAGYISPEAMTLQVPTGVFKLKFANHFLEKVEVRGGETTEILLGAIAMPTLTRRTVEVYSQESSGHATYSTGFAGYISPETNRLQLPAGTYKLKFAKHFVENIVVQPGEEVVL